MICFLISWAFNKWTNIVIQIKLTDVKQIKASLWQSQPQNALTDSLHISCTRGAQCLLLEQLSTFLAPDNTFRDY